MNSSNVVRPELGQWDGTDGLCNLLPAVFPEIILYLLLYYFLVHSFSFVVVLPLTKARNLGFFSFCGTESKRKYKTRVMYRETTSPREKQQLMLMPTSANYSRMCNFLI